MIGRVHRLNISNGGVPKGAVDRIDIRTVGIVGDAQHDTEHHGGPMRAVSLFSLEVIERLREQGHPIEPGTTGENVTLAGLDWPAIGPGDRICFEGGVELEVTSFVSPCKTIAGSFCDGESKRISQKLHPGESRLYARVLREGIVAAGETVSVVHRDGG